MNFLADESVDRAIVEHLRQEGHRVSYIAELGPGMPDDAVLNLANQETALLLTVDKDFGEMVFRQCKRLTNTPCRGSDSAIEYGPVRGPGNAGVNYHEN